MKYFSLLFFLTALFIFSACENDVELYEPDVAPDKLTINSKDHRIRGAYKIDYGIIDFGNLDRATHFNTDLMLSSEGLHNGNGAFPDQISLVYVELFSSDTTGLAEGTYQFVRDDEVNFDKVGGENFFFSAFMVENGDQAATQRAFQEIIVEQGTVVITGKGNNLRLNIQLQFEDGGTVKATYNGDLASVSSNGRITNARKTIDKAAIISELSAI